MSLPTIPDEIARALRAASGLLGLLALALPSRSAAQEPARPPLVRARDSVRELQEVHSPEEARRSIERLEVLLEESSDPDTQALYLYTLGWLSERAAPSAEQEAQALAAADGYYAAMLEIKPRHAQASQDLARVRGRLGRVDEALEVLREAFGGESAEYFWNASDVLARGGRWKEALQAYERACRARPEDQGSAWRIVGQLPAIPDELGQELLALCGELSGLGFVAVALEGWLELVARGQRGEAHAALAERALLEWVGTQARRDALDAATLARLPVEHPGTPALRALFAEPPAEVDAGHWLDSDARSAAFFEALRARARAEERAGRPDSSERLYVRARHVRSLSADARLAVMLDLAMLYHVHSGLPDADGKFQALERELFQIKGEAYLGHDLATMEQSHRTLALIYLERGAFDPPERLRGARYHVERAVATARERAQRGADDYAPYPDLCSRLARGLGKGTAAVDFHLLAARGYLEVDDLARAQVALSEAGAAAGDGLGDSQRLHSDLGTVLELRSRIRSGSDLTLTDGRLPALASTQLSPTFLERQHIRALADLGKRLDQRDARVEVYYTLAFTELQQAKGATWREVLALGGSVELLRPTALDPDAPTPFVGAEELPLVEWKKWKDLPPPWRKPR